MINIAIDGPSGAGKSTIAKMLAKKLNIIYLDTGAMYRCVALKALSLGVDVTDEQAVDAMLSLVDLKIEYDNGVQKMYVDGIDVSKAIREHHMSKAASDVSRHPKVRAFLVKMQQKIASENDVVLDGRDITTVVLPNAKYKFYLDASVEIRAHRRQIELKEKGEDIPYEKILSDIKQRDYNDSHRPVAPLTRTADSIYIDNSVLSLEESFEKILSYIEVK